MENQLYVKMEKCTFAQPDVRFLGHKIKDERIYMDERKIKAISKWEPPKNVSELRSFLSLVNYYRRFISEYSARSTPLTDLLKKKVAWEWTDRCQEMFEELKKAVMKEPILALPNYSKPFQVQTDDLVGENTKWRTVIEASCDMSPSPSPSNGEFCH
ncbi:hypothetical protein Lser_V15G12595 [Lactuca serriola]